MADDCSRLWVKAIGRKLREDLGDQPTLPTELQHLLEQLKAYDDRNENHPTRQGTVRRELGK
jgi:hypothetical protein